MQPNDGVLLNHLPQISLPSPLEDSKDEQNMANTKALMIHTRKFMTNCHLFEKQFVFNVLHPRWEIVSKVELKEKLTKIYDVRNPNTIIVLKFRKHFGGRKSTVFGLIYNNIESVKKYEPKYRLIRNGCATKHEKLRKQVKERNNRAMKVHGVKKIEAGEAGKGKKK